MQPGDLPNPREMARLLPATILAGGRSQRFGEDKACVSIEGQPLLLRLRDQLRAAGHEVRYVADRADRYRALNIECLVDAQADSGPLAGLATALAYQKSLLTSGQHTSPWILLVSCDLVQWLDFWTVRLMDVLVTVGVPPDERLAVVFGSSMWQPLPGLYHIDLLEQVQQRLDERRLSLHGLLESCTAEGKCFVVNDENPPNRWTFNTREELNRLLLVLGNSN